ncbi:hypothetical protein M569_09903, partial [Genlisea aurea]
MAAFRQALMDCELRDLPHCGHPFTWTNKRKAPHTVCARLDRAVDSSSWLQLFPNTRTMHLPFGGSDHAPLWVQFSHASPPAKSFGARRFRFEARWMMLPGCETTIRGAWSHQQNLQRKLGSTRISLLKWYQHQIVPLKTNIKKVEAELARLAVSPVDDSSIARETLLKAELTALLHQEELFWKQISKVHWLAKGDRNTAYFHACASARKDFNHISSITDSDGVRHSAPREIHTAFAVYFSGLFSLSHPSQESILSSTRAITSRLSEAMRDRLSAPFTSEEIWPALKSMKALSAPGPDGFSPVFFQRYWAIVHEEVSESILRLLNGHQMEGDLNHTHIILIPKVSRPEAVHQFRPISLCNVLYKIASKMVANRLKPIMDSLITEEQSAFLPGRAIADNVLMAFEINHSLRRNQSSIFGSLKLDVSKAYDRLEWSFIREVLESMAFPARFIDLVMLLISSVTYSVLVNGSTAGRFAPTRGIRQGDPLSPYLFILCADTLSAMLKTAASGSPDIGVQIAPGAPRISHLLFADDTIIYVRATLASMCLIKSVLASYEAASGQVINLEKSLLILSRGGDEHHRHLLAETVGIPLAPGLGRAVLIKAVLQAIPVFSMSCFLLPKTFLAKLMGTIARFWWSGNGAKKLHWLPWEQLTSNLAAGGMGFRDLCLFNKALVAKQGWRLVSRPNSLCGRLLKAKYFPHSSFLRAPLGRAPSFAWRSIHSSKDVLAQGLRWRIGTGHLDMKVNSLIRNDLSDWNVALLRRVFSPTDVQHILSIPLSTQAYPDRLIWHYTSHGEYSVKSGYRILKDGAEGLLPSSSTANPGYINFWKALSKLKIPARIITFGWRL